MIVVPQMRKNCEECLVLTSKPLQNENEVENKVLFDEKGAFAPGSNPVFYGVPVSTYFSNNCYLKRANVLGGKN